MVRVKYLRFILLVSVLAWNLHGASHLNAQSEPFYKSKTVRLIVGLSPGGFYDRWARLLARFMPLYMPGNPNFIVQNMPGAGSMIAMNHVFGVAKPDGLTLVMPNYGVYLDQIAERKEVRFDITKGYLSARRRRAISFSMRARMLPLSQSRI